MENIDLTLVIGRYIERISVVGAGVMSLYLGYKLYIQNIIYAQTAEFKKGEISLSLKRVAPGAFFALFGSLLLAGVWFSRLELGQLQQGSGFKGGFRLAENISPKSEKPTSSVRLMNSLLLLSEQGHDAEESAILADIAKHRSFIERYRDEQVKNHLGAHSVDQWNLLKNRRDGNLTSLPAHEREAAEKLKPWFVETLADE